MTKQLLKALSYFFLIFALMQATSTPIQKTQQQDQSKRIKADLNKAHTFYEKGELVRAYESVHSVYLELARQVIRDYNQKSVNIRSMGFFKKNGFVEEAFLKSGPVFYSGEEFYIIVYIDNLDWEERNGKFRFNVQEVIKITGPDGNVVLEEMPVNILSEWIDFIPEINFSNRIPLEPEWGPGKYKVEITVYDALTPQESQSKHVRERSFLVLEKPNYKSIQTEPKNIPSGVPEDFSLKYEWGRNSENLGERGFSIDAKGNVLKWRKIGADLCSYSLKETYSINHNEIKKIIEGIQDSQITDSKISSDFDSNTEKQIEVMRLTLDGKSYSFSNIRTPGPDIDGIICLVEDILVENERYLDTESFFQEYCKITKMWIEKAVYSEMNVKVQFKECGVYRDGKYHFTADIQFTKEGKSKTETETISFSSLDEIYKAIFRQLQSIYRELY